MNSVTTFPRLAVTILTILFSIGFSVGSQEVITTVSGTHVPIDLVQAHFVKKILPSDHGSVLYELTDHVLRGSDLFLDLRSDLHSVHAKREPSTATVTLNGVSKSFSSEKLRTVRVKSYSVIVNDETNQVLAVTGNGVVLTPVHRVQFPDIFVNKMALSNPRSDLSSDLRILGKERTFGVSTGTGSNSVGEDVRVLGRATEKSTTVSDVATRQSGGSCAGGTTHYLEIAVAYDNTFCALYDDEEGTATKALEDVVDEANTAYAVNTCIQLALVHVEAHCNDPSDPYEGFSRFSPEQILNTFQSIWMESREDIERDAAYLITGFQDGTSVAGIAYIAAACSSRNGYGWIEGPSSIIMAHEIGHTLGGQHTSSGIMGAVATGGTQPSFSAQSVQQFDSYIDSSSGSACIETAKPPGIPGGTSPPTTTSTVPQGPAATPEPQQPTTAPEPQQPTTAPEPQQPEATPDVPSGPTIPVPDEPSVGRGGKCASGFTRSKSLSCSVRRLREIMFSDGDEVIGKLRTSLQQRNGQLIVRFRATNDLYVSKYRGLVTTDRELLRSGVGKGEYETPTGNGKKVDLAFNAGDMPKPAGEMTCCGSDLYIGIDVSVCITTTSGMEFCQTISEMYMSTIACKSACRGTPTGTFTAMSAEQECPSCT